MVLGFRVHSLTLPYSLLSATQSNCLQGYAKENGNYHISRVKGL